MNILVAGATGALGIPLVRALVAQGYAVSGLTRTPKNASCSLHWGPSLL